MNRSLLGNALLLAALLAASHATLRYAAGQGPLLSWPRAGLTALALAVYGFIFLYYGSLLERMPLSKLYPVYTAISVALVALIGVTAFGEPWSARYGLGILLLLSGVFLVSS